MEDVYSFQARGLNIDILLTLDAGSATSQRSSEEQVVLPIELQESLRFGRAFTGAADAPVMASPSGRDQRAHFGFSELLLKYVNTIVSVYTACR